MSPLPRLVLLPGLDGTGLLFEPFLRALPQDVSVSVIRYPVDQPLGYDKLFSLILEQLPVGEPFVVLGESFSGPLAVRLAATSPAGLRGLILVATFVRKPVRWCPGGIGPRLPVSPFRWLPLCNRIRLRLTRNVTAERRELFSRALRQIPPEILAHRVAEVLRVDVSQELQRISVPILSLTGRTDRVVPSWNGRLIQQLCPRARSTTIESNHWLLQTAPDQAANAVCRFLTEIQTSGTPSDQLDNH